jgi:hypothetical protein
LGRYHEKVSNPDSWGNTTLINNPWLALLVDDLPVADEALMHRRDLSVALRMAIRPVDTSDVILKHGLNDFFVSKAC